MKTAVVISSPGFVTFRFDLLKEPDSVRFIGIFTEQDVGNLPESHRKGFHQIHVVPCAVEDPPVLLRAVVDIDATRSIIRELLAHTRREDLFILCYFELTVEIAAQLRSEFDIQGPKAEDILPFRDKCLMKQKLIAKGIRVPKFGYFQPELFARDASEYFHKIASDVGLPFILKPIDSAGAEGVYKIASRSDFDRLTGDLGRDYEYEEFIKGTMYSANLVSKNRNTVFGGVTEYLVNTFDVQSGKVNADINLSDDDPRVARMVRFAESALDALGWPDGGSHLELFLTDRDELVFLEVAARFKGMAGLAAMVRNYGISFLNMAIEIETGVESLPYDGEVVYCFDGVLPSKHGIIERLVEPELESEVAMTWKVKPGDTVVKTDSLLATVGHFLVWNKDYDALYRDFKALATYEPIVYKAQPSTPQSSGQRSSGG